MSEQSPIKKDKILVAEDSSPNRKILAHLLVKLGFEALEFENGKLAWEGLQANPDAVAVISDVMMPEMNGLELLERIRSSSAHANLPVLLVTAVSDKEYILRAKQQKASGYILKPLTFARVTAKLQEIFPSRIFPKIAA